MYDIILILYYSFDKPGDHFKVVHIQEAVYWPSQLHKYTL